MNERELFNKLTEAKMFVLKEFPFFGRLLQTLSLGLADCGTAFTDMTRIVFDPQFASRLSGKEVKYVMLHEVLHCALKHCTRGVGKSQFVYNVACDIVVNSTIMKMYRLSSLVIDGSELIHVAPDGVEGSEYTAEQVYSMLMDISNEEFEKTYCENEFDSHENWEKLNCPMLEDVWNSRLTKAWASSGSTSGVPALLERFLKEINHLPRTNWRQLLHDFIQTDRNDYNFLRPDNRYPSDIFIPSFCETDDGGKIDNLLFFADTSGSVSDEALSIVYAQIKSAIEQVGNISAKICFFDHKVSDPIAFESIEELSDIKPTGGGGTDFGGVFKKLAEIGKNDGLPVAVIIMTDGYDVFPKEEMALGVPVIWVIVGSDVVPPWGVYAYVGN